MNKEKIAISIDSDLLSEIDSIVDGTKLRSRSQAIEVLLKDSIKSKPITSAVMLVHEKEKGCLFSQIDGMPLIQHHLNFLMNNKIKDFYIVAKADDRMRQFSQEKFKNINIHLIDERQQNGTANALKLLKDKLTSDFVVINGDTFNDFDIRRMMQRHKSGKYVCTMGLISSNNPSKFGSAIMDGEMIVDFKEKGQAESNIINAGIYIFKPNVFLLYDESTKSLEKDLFPKLAKVSLLQGFFTLGKYVHAPDLNP
ncbi:MAG: sugar phosphate nucleotidyltransferase [Nanoarchaeota archaeon]